MKPITIGDIQIGPGLAPFIIAEMSGNHGQSLEKAYRLIDAAAEAGARGAAAWRYAGPGGQASGGDNSDNSGDINDDEDDYGDNGSDAAGGQEEGRGGAAGGLAGAPRPHHHLLVSRAADEARVREE